MSGGDGRPDSRCMRSDAPLTSHTAAFGVCCYLAEGFLPQSGGARASRLLWRSERIYREGLLPVGRFVRLLDDWIGPRRR
jgi:hypothetical protein